MSTSSVLKLLSFTTKNANKIPRIGAIVEGDKVFDITSAMGIPSMKHFIESGTENLKSLRSIMNEESNAHRNVSLGAIQLLAPIPRPNRNIICVGKNYKDHVAEVNAVADATAQVATPQTPVFFTKAPECVIGPFDDVESHASTTKWLDYEAELAVIIGKQGRDISKSDALSHVFGYSIGNDITARDLQKRHLQWFKGKSLDKSCPMGPYIVPSADIGDASRLGIKLWVNGHLRQNSCTSNMIFDVSEIIHQLSKGMTLFPGDIILTGTPEGVGFAMKPTPSVLKTGDQIRIQIEGIGELCNGVL